MHVGGRLPSAAHADFAGGRARMINRDERAEIPRMLEQSIHVSRALAEIDELGDAEDVRVSYEGRDLATGDQQQLIEVRLQFTHRVVMRGGVVVGDGDEIEPTLARGVEREKHRTRDL